MFPTDSLIELYGRREASRYPFPIKEQFIIPLSPEFVCTYPGPATDQYDFLKYEEQPLEIQPTAAVPVVQQAGVPVLYLAVIAGLLLLFLFIEKGKGLNK